MMRTILIPTALAALLALATASEVHAYGAYHASYTTCGGGSVQHYGSTSSYGGYGGTSVSHSGSTTVGPYGGAQHTGSTTVSGPGGASYTGSTTRAYSPTTYGGYGATGVSGGYSSSVTRTGYYP